MEAKVSNKSYQIEVEENNVSIDGKKANISICAVDDHCISLIYNGKQTKALIEEIDPREKMVKLIINQKSIEVKLKDTMDLLLEKMGLSDTSSSRMSDLKSPMPGLVIDIKVNVGDEVNKGDLLIVLEAMKMENSLKASAEGVVKEILVSTNESVEKGQVLISFI